MYSTLRYSLLQHAPPASETEDGVPFKVHTALYGVVVFIVSIMGISAAVV